MSRSLLMMGFWCSGSRPVQIGAAYMQHQPIDGQAVRTVQIKVRPHSNAHSCKKNKDLLPRLYIWIFIGKRSPLIRYKIPAFKDYQLQCTHENQHGREEERDAEAIIPCNGEKLAAALF